MGKNKQVTCKICYKEMRSNNLGRHMKVHFKNQPENKPNEEMCRELVLELVDNVVEQCNPTNDLNVSWQCEICDLEFTTKTHLKRHIESLHNGVKFPCNQCNFVTNRKDNFKRHQKIKHGGSEPEKETRIIDQVDNDVEGRNMQVTCKESDHLPTHMKVQVKNESKIPYEKNTEDSNNMDELMKESIEVWKIYKLLQRIKE